MKQRETRTGGLDDPSLRYFIGDVRDAARLERALYCYAAALKQVAACEYNPFEAIPTNLVGGRKAHHSLLFRARRPAPRAHFP